MPPMFGRFIDSELYTMPVHRDPGSYRSYNSNVNLKRGVCQNLIIMV